MKKIVIANIGKMKPTDMVEVYVLSEASKCFKQLKRRIDAAVDRIICTVAEAFLRIKQLNEVVIVKHKIARSVFYRLPNGKIVYNLKGYRRYYGC